MNWDSPLQSREPIYLEFHILALRQLVSECDHSELIASVDELGDLLVGVGDSLGDETALLPEATHWLVHNLHRGIST